MNYDTIVARYERLFIEKVRFAYYRKPVISYPPYGLPTHYQRISTCDRPIDDDKIWVNLGLFLEEYFPESSTNEFREIAFSRDTPEILVYHKYIRGYYTIYFNIPSVKQVITLKSLCIDVIPTYLNSKNIQNLSGLTTKLQNEIFDYACKTFDIDYKYDARLYFSDHEYVDFSNMNVCGQTVNFNTLIYCNITTLILSTTDVKMNHLKLISRKMKLVRLDVSDCVNLRMKMDYRRNGRRIMININDYKDIIKKLSKTLTYIDMTKLLIKRLPDYPKITVLY